MSEEPICGSSICWFKLENKNKNMNFLKPRNCIKQLKSAKRVKSLSVGAPSGDKSRKIL